MVCTNSATTLPSATILDEYSYYTLQSITQGETPQTNTSFYYNYTSLCVMSCWPWRTRWNFKVIENQNLNKYPFSAISLICPDAIFQGIPSSGNPVVLSNFEINTTLSLTWFVLWRSISESDFFYGYFSYNKHWRLIQRFNLPNASTSKFWIHSITTINMSTRGGKSSFHPNLSPDTPFSKISNNLSLRIFNGHFNASDETDSNPYIYLNII